MRNLLKAFVAVPLIVSLMNGLPASAVAAEGGPPMECTYDNSIVITATVPAERSFAPADFPEIDCKNAVIAEKVWQDPAFRYRVVLILRDEGDIAVQKAMHSVRNNALVSNVGRNDYVDRDSSMALNESSINLRVGEQKNLTIASLDLVHKNNKQVGVSFSIDPDVIDAGSFEKDSFLSYGVDRFWPDTDKHENILSDKPDNLEATASDNGTYYGLIDEQRISYLRTIDKLAAVPGVLSASIVYVGIPGGEPDYERWTSSHPEIAGLTLSGGEPDRVSGFSFKISDVFWAK